MPVITCVEDLKRIYKRRTPRMFYDYAESGSWTEQTFRENTTDFQEIHLRQRVAIDMAGRSTKSQMIGQDVSMPVALAPVGLTGMQSADGEIKAARAAEKFGVPTRCRPCRSARSRMSPKTLPSHSGYKSTHSKTMTSCSACLTAPKPPNVRPRSSRWIFRCWASATRTSKTACPPRPS